MTLTTEQQIEMKVAIREARRSGQPEKAIEIAAAMEAQVFSLADETPGAVVLPDPPPTHGPGSGISKWRDFAYAYSDFDSEIVESTPKQDLIKMLRANGLVE